MDGGDEMPPLPLFLQLRSLDEHVRPDTAAKYKWTVINDGHNVF